ncbi:MAG: preprotein translocase subunit SecY [Bacteroidota bacterium]
MKNLFSTIKDIYSIKTLRKRLAYTLFFAFIYRLGTYVLLPWLNSAKVVESFKRQAEENYWDKVFGTSLSSHSLFSLGISPYISASIVMQLFTFSIPYFQRLQQEGTAGRNKINQYTRQLAIIMAILQGIPTLANTNNEFILGINTWGKTWFRATSLVLMIASVMFCIWLADCISEKGIGNGTSILIMTGILSKLPAALKKEWYSKGKTALFLFVEGMVFLFIVIAVIVFIQGVRKVTLQYARQMTMDSNKYSGKQHHLPIKMNITGVMPIIFASMFVGILRWLASFLKDKVDFAKSIEEALQLHKWQCNALQAVLIFLSTFIYAAIFTNPAKIANDLKRSGGFISGVKPGRATTLFLDRTISLVVAPAALFLALVAMLPSVAYWAGVSEEFSVFYGGSSLLIIVSVVLEMVQHVESNLSMLYYDKMMVGLKNNTAIPY